MCFLVVAVSPFASVEVEVLVELWALSVEAPVELLLFALPDWASLCGMELLSVLFIEESLEAESVF